MRWEVERDRFGVMFSGPLEVGECIEVVPASFTDEDVEGVARALNLEAGRQRGLAIDDDWNDTTEQERGAWRLCARAALSAYLQPTTKGDT